MDETPKLPSPDAPLVATRGANDLSGTTFGGYKLVSKIAQGGMGVIYEAIQTKLDRKVALKILSEPLASRVEFLQRFEREAKAAAALNHPNVVQVHDFGEANGRHFIIMEFVEGHNLSAYVAIRGKLSVEEALDIIEQAARALKAAAEKSIIHRDIKPSNLMLTKNGVVKVADLGLAKILTQDSELTMSNIVGSPHFIAPEQAADSRHADHRVDIYSLGLTLFFLLTGKYPYDGNSPISIVLAHTQKPLPSAAELGVEIPAEVEALIHRMAAKNPDERYQDYDSLLADLQLVKQGCAPMTLPSLPPQPPEQTQPAKSKKELVAGISILAFVVLVAVASLIFAFSRKQSPQNKIAAANPIAPVVDSIAPTAPVATPPMESKPAPPQPPENNFQPPQDEPPDQQELPENGKLSFRFAMPMGLPPRTPPPTPAQSSAVADIIKQYESKMRAALARNDWQEAYDVWTNFPPNLRSRETDLQIMDLLQKNLPSDFMPRLPANAPQPPSQ